MSQFQDGLKRVAKQTDYHQHSFLGRNLIQPPRFPFLLSRKPSLLLMFFLVVAVELWLINGSNTTVGG